MPTKRRRLMRRRTGAAAVAPAVWAVVNDAPAAGFVFHPEDVGEAWHTFGPQILSRWIQEQPGTRPSCWWRFEALAPRQRLGGRGTPAHGVLAHAQRYELGLPVDWVSETFAVELAVEAFDVARPPLFESQATYLKRLGLLARGELRRIPAGSEDAEDLPRRLWPFTEAGVLDG